VSSFLTTADITGGLVLATLLGLLIAAFLIDRVRTERVVFTSAPTVTGPGLCGCGAPKCTPPPAPFPGDRPVLAAPAAEPAPAEPAADSAWTRHEVRDVWARLNAEAKP
jgi:hypothetical protein